MGEGTLPDWKVNRPVRLAAFWAAYLAVSAVALAIYIRIVPSPDQWFFDYLAWLHLQGAPFYKGLFDMTWPGELFLHDFYLRLFGVHSWTARAGDFLILQPAVLAIFEFLRRAGFPRAAVAAALVYPIIYVTSGGWMAGHRDFIATHFVIGAAIFALPSVRPGAWRPLLAGVLIGCATMMRPTFLAFVMMFPLALQQWRGAARWPNALVTQGLLFGLGLVTPIVFFIIYALATGTLHDWYVDSFRFVVDVYPVPEGRGRLPRLAAGVIVSMMWWLAIAAAIGAAFWMFLGRSKTGLALVAAMLATILLSYVVQNKGFGYHLAGLIPTFLILGCAGADAAFELPLRTAPLRNGAALLLAALLTLGTGLRLDHARPVAPDWGRQDQGRALTLSDSQALADIVRTESAETDKILIWGWEFQVGTFAERQSATRFVNTMAARLIRPGQPIFGSWLDEFDRELRDQPPKFILVDQTVIPPDGRLPSQSTARDDAMLQVVKRRVNSGYAIRAQHGTITLLKRVD